MKKIKSGSNSFCCVSFTSDNFEKEKNGMKNNIVKLWKKSDNRFKLLDDFQNGLTDVLLIRVMDIKSNNSFDEVVKDVTTFESFGRLYYVITWEVDDKN